MKLLSILSILASLVACNTNYSNCNFTKVEYHFHDASVSPAYHRSYIIQTQQDHLHMEVSDYEGVRLDTIFPVSADKFKELVSLCRLQDKKGITEGLAENGGSTQELYFYNTNGLVSDYLWRAGNSSSFTKIIDYLKGLIPNFDETLHLRNKLNPTPSTIANHNMN